MIEEIEEVWERLRLNEEEVNPIEVDLGNMDELRRKWERSLEGMISSKSAIGKEVLQVTMGQIWHVSKKMEFTNIGVNYFVVTFASQGDRNKVLVGC